jgi:TPR repeat protein
MSLTNQRPGDRQKPLKAIGILAVCLVFGSLLALWFATRTPPVAAPEVPEVIDLEGTRANAERGDAEAQNKLGSIYAKGQGVKQSYAEAAKWYRQAADQGNAGAQTALGELYEAGQGVPCDEAKAAQWYRRAAEQGHVAGQYSLAVLYVMGKGVPRDIAEAVKWYRQAADQGNALAQYNLGMRYKEGDGVPQDRVEAYKWLRLAAAQGLPDAAKARDELKRSMTREQLAEGQRRADAFVARTPVPPAH